MSEETGLDSWFLHEKLVLSLLSEADALELGRRMPGPGHPFAKMQRVSLFERTLGTYLANNDIASLGVAFLQGGVQQGQLVWIEQAISFSGAGPAWETVRNGGSARASFSTRLSTDKDVRVNGTYNAEWLTCSTAPGKLSGTSPQFMVGYVESVSLNEIEIRPIVIAQRWIRPTPEIGNWNPVDPAHVWPAAVDQFSAVDFKQRMTKKDLDLLKVVPEEQVKRAFAQILGEPDVPKDWAGEQFDLWSPSRLTVEGQPLRAAFLFKGPAKFHPMTIADLGKNGDQIDRLAQTAADLMVVQHCHSITAPVVNMLKNYANNPRNPKRYMCINGYDTIMILRHFGAIT